MFFFDDICSLAIMKGMDGYLIIILIDLNNAATALDDHSRSVNAAQI